MREKRRGIRANRLWPRMYGLIHQERSDAIQNENNDCCRISNIPATSPKWVWKGFPRISERLGLDSDTTSITELAKVLDTFILTSNLAECQERLALVKSFANEVRHECCVNGLKRLPLARLLHSLGNYYQRLMPILLQKRDRQREPIEKRLKDEVKLAKWDEQTYYSLAESSEKNHRKLMKFLRDYDEVLDLTVMSVLEQNFVEGIRSISQTKAGDHEPITAIPSTSTMFPELTQNELDEKLTTPKSKSVNLNLIIEAPRNDWVAAGLSDCVDKYVTEIGHYNKRMKSIMMKNISWAHKGATSAADFVDAIFLRIESLRDTKTTKQVKQRALVDLFKYLKDQGLSSMKWSVPAQIRQSHQLLQLPTPLINNTSGPTLDALEKGESYFNRCQVEISRIRSEISMLGSQYMSQREMMLMEGYSDHILFLLCQERSMVADMIQTIAECEKSLDGYKCITDGIPLGQHKLSKDAVQFESSIALAIEGLWQLVLLLKEVSSFADGGNDRDRVRDTITILTGCAQKLKESYSASGGRSPVSFDCIQSINVEMPKILCGAKRDVASCVELCGDILPPSIFDSCICNIDRSLELALAFTPSTNGTEVTGSASEQVALTLASISTFVQRTLISAQSVCIQREDPDKNLSPDQPQAIEDDMKISASHTKMINEWDGLQLSQLNTKMHEVSKSLLLLHDDQSPDSTIRSLCTRSAINSFTLVQNVLELSKTRLRDAALFYRQHTKLLYVLLRVFRVLIAKGFCSDDVSDGGEGDGEGGAGEMKFEDDVEGTGMGEGDGKNDVTDQIENEEQLLGLKGDDQEEKASSQENKELNQDEVDTGMEMEGEFEGETFDMPEQQQDENQDKDEGNEEELDREMGEGNDPNEQVVDEKMWDKDEDDLNEMNQDEEKFEDNSKMSGEKLDDEMRTKDDEEGADEQGNQDADKHDPNQNENAPDEAAESNKDESENINDDTEDKYEDSHRMDVRDDEKAAEETNEEELDIDLNDGLDIDDEPDGDAADQGDNASASEEMDDVPDTDTMDENGEAEAEAEGEEEEEGVEESEAIDVAGQGGKTSQPDADEQDPEEENDEDEPNVEYSSRSQHDSKEEMHGVAAADGEDTVKENNEQDEDNDAKDDGKAEENPGGADENVGESSQGSGGSGNDGAWQSGQSKVQEKGQSNDFDEVPNPLRDPGDVEKFWHKKLDIINDTQDTDESSPQETSGQEPQQQDTMDQDGVFEYSRENEESNGQVLGTAEEEQAKQLQENNEDEFQPNSNESKDTSDVEMEDRSKQSRRNETKPAQSDATQTPPKEQTVPQEEKPMEGKDEQPQQDKTQDEIDEPKKHENRLISEDTVLSTNRMPSEVSDVDMDETNDDIQEMEVSTEYNTLDLQQARVYWQSIQSETNNLSRRLCEKLRLVMEPLVATKLRGDYRTGKRVNMKRIIGYIASGYRKDKIWLRRTKPAKRDYRILIAVDDSESMQKSQSGDMALRALATLANGMSQLEVGQLGVASFGEEMKLIHPFNIPFTSESGVNVVSNFTFCQKRTRTALCVESSIAALESVESVSSSMQLVFMISDGRIERDSRSKLRRLIRQMSEENMLLVMIIVEGEDANDPSNKGKESILNMKEVSFVNGKPKIKHFIEDYPFPYYLVVSDLAALPEILGDALRQWFEMMAQIQNGV